MYERWHESVQNSFENSTFSKRWLISYALHLPVIHLQWNKSGEHREQFLVSLHLLQMWGLHTVTLSKSETALSHKHVIPLFSLTGAI